MYLRSYNQEHKNQFERANTKFEMNKFEPELIAINEGNDFTSVQFKLWHDSDLNP